MSSIRVSGGSVPSTPCAWSAFTQVQHPVSHKPYPQVFVILERSART